MEIKILSTEATLPERQTKGSAGYDLRAYLKGQKITIRLGEAALIPTGLKMAIPLDYEAQIESRREVVEKYSKELEHLENEQTKRKAEIDKAQEKFHDVENTISISGGKKARELQEELDRTRVAHALSQRNSESAKGELEELER